MNAASKDEPLVFLENPELYPNHVKNELGEYLVDMYGVESRDLNYPCIVRAVSPEEICGMSIRGLESMFDVKEPKEIRHVAAEYKKNGFHLKIGVSGPIGGVASSIS